MSFEKIDHILTALHYTISSFSSSHPRKDVFPYSPQVTLETTIGNSNVDLWQYVKPTNSVVEGIRSMVANRLTTSGKNWTDMFKKYNSGT